MGAKQTDSSNQGNNGKLKIALAGNPNSGKTTLFNALTGLNQQVGNFPGVTVEKKSGSITLKNSGGQKVNVELTDLPGAYSIYPKSLDERVQCDILINTSHEDHPDLVVYVADASNLKRSLFLCTQLIDLGLPLILVLNMMDLVEKEGDDIDREQLEKEFGIPLILMSARSSMGVDELKQKMLTEVGQPTHHFIDETEIETPVINEIQQVEKVGVYQAFQLASNYPLLSDDKVKREIEEIVGKNKFNSLKYQRQETLARYKKINALLTQILKHGSEGQAKLTQKLDNILTHKVWGFAIFLGILFMVFQAIFSWSEYPMMLLEEFFVILSTSLKDILPEGILADLLVDGVLAGLSGILVFIPQIALLFFFIAILEDTGYMARVSFIMDKLMRKVGLNGRSVIPLISGVACAVPAIMSARTISNWKERIITIMVTPLMSCSARLPVYTLLISLAVPSKTVLGFLNLQGLVMMGLYLIGFLAAIGAALVLKWIIKARERSYFIMELPVYRAPRWSSIGLTITEKVKLFVFEAGKVIIAVSIVLWVLSSYGPASRMQAIEDKYSAEQATSEYTQEEIDNRIASEKLEASYAGIFGKAIEPVIKPLGFDWKIGIALFTSFAAREVFVGTMATIYSAGDEENTTSIREKMKEEINPDTGEKHYNLAVVFSLLIFYAFAMQCMSTLAVVFAETKSWKWPLIQLTYMSALAYLSSLIVYQVLS